MENRRFVNSSLPTCFIRSISAYMTHRNAIPKATPIFLESGNSTAPMGIQSDVTGSQKSKMAAIKQEVPIYQLLYKMATPFQRLTPIFGVQEFNCAIIMNTARRNRKLEIQVGNNTGGSGSPPPWWAAEG